jgi:CheY-like chemotaxis protein
MFLTVAAKLIEYTCATVFQGIGAAVNVSWRAARFGLALAKEVIVITKLACATVREPGPAEKCRILIVDDNEDLATSLARLLGLLGHEVEVVFDGRRGLEAARTSHPRVLLLDLSLPQVDGYQVARSLRDEGYHDILIIALSGYGHEDDQQRSREAGIDYHMIKPADYRAIAELIARAS